MPEEKYIGKGLSADQVTAAIQQVRDKYFQMYEAQGRLSGDQQSTLLAVGRMDAAADIFEDLYQRINMLAFL